jgi:type I restriction enzyme S subunit
MKAGWQTKKLGEICEIERGGSPRPIQKFITDDPRGINWIKIADATASDKYIYKTEEKIKPEGVKRSRMVYEGDFLLSNSMSFGRPYIMKTTGCIHDGWLVLHQPKVDPDYLYYVLSSDLVFSQFDRLAAGSTVRNLNIGLAKSVEIPYPALPEQQRIVGILDGAFEGIATATANTKKNIQNAWALFERHLHAVFTTGGEEVPLSELATDITDGDHSPPPKASSGVPFITISDVVKKTREIDFSNTFSVPEWYFRNLKPNKRPKVGDVLYTVTGATLGIPILVKQQLDFCFQRHIGLIRPKPDTDSAWLSYALLSPQVFRQATSGSTGTAQKTVSLSVLRNLKLPKKQLTEQQATAVRLDALASQIHGLEGIYRRKLAALDALKQSLLHQAFTGAL